MYYEFKKYLEDMENIGVHVTHVKLPLRKYVELKAQICDVYDNSFKIRYIGIRGEWIIKVSVIK